MGIDADELRKLLEEAGLDSEEGVAEQGMPNAGPLADTEPSISVPSAV